MKKKSCEAALKAMKHVSNCHKMCVTNAVGETNCQRRTSANAAAAVLDACLSRLSGYYGEGLNAIIVFAACHLPDSSCEDYTYIMENLFL